METKPAFINPVWMYIRKFCFVYSGYKRNSCVCMDVVVHFENKL